MSTAQERLNRLVERHTDFQPLGDDVSNSAIIRRGALLAPAANAAQVEESVRRWVDQREDMADLGLARFRLRGGADVPDLITASFSPEGAARLASPVHVFRGEPSYSGGPATKPEPVAPGTETPRGRPGKVRVAVLDTGLARHPWFPPQTWESLDQGDVTDLLDEDNDYDLDAQAGHGTFVAGIVRRHAPDAHITVGRVLGSGGVCDEVDLLTALRQVGQLRRSPGRRVDVVNLSLGAFTWDDEPPAFLAQALAALGAETVVVAAAGNAGVDRVFWPAALDSVVGVGALTSDGGDPATFSNTGAWVDAWAVGDRVQSSFVTFDGTEPPVADIDPDCFKGFATWSGTSFAAPRVTAEVARRAEDQRRAAADVLPEVLRDFAAPVGAAGGSDSP